MRPPLQVLLQLVGNLVECDASKAKRSTQKLSDALWHKGSPELYANITGALTKVVYDMMSSSKRLKRKLATFAARSGAKKIPVYTDAQHRTVVRGIRGHLAAVNACLGLGAALATLYRAAKALN